MGKNKDRLTANNLDLTAILRGINNLPPAGGEDLQSTAQAQNTAVTELLKMVSRKVANHKGEGAYVWKKLTAEGGDFIDFVVSADTGAYPNGAVHTDGYWYEFMEEGLTPEMFLGCTKYAVDKFTYTTNQSMGGKTLNHSLGKVPKLAFVSAPDLTTHSLAYETFWLSGSARVYTVKTTSNPTNIFSSSHGIKNVTAAAITLSSDSIYFAAGVEYTLITMA